MDVVATSKFSYQLASTNRDLVPLTSRETGVDAVDVAWMFLIKSTGVLNMMI